MNELIEVEKEMSKAEIYKSIKDLKEFMYKVDSLTNFSQIDVAISQLMYFIYSKPYLFNEMEIRCQKWESFSKTFKAKRFAIVLSEAFGIRFSKRDDHIYETERSYIRQFGLYTYFRYHLTSRLNNYKEEHGFVLTSYNPKSTIDTFIWILFPSMPLRLKIEIYEQEYNNLDFYILKNEIYSNDCFKYSPDYIGTYIYKSCISHVCYEMINKLYKVIEINNTDQSYLMEEFIQTHFPEVSNLTPTEKIIFDLLCQRKSNKEIAQELGYPKDNNNKTIEKHSSNIYCKLGVKGKIELSEKYKFFLSL